MREAALLLEINPHADIPIFRQIESQIRRLILSTRLEAGTPITSVRDLAASLKVNPLTVSKAYSNLEREGLLERRRGVGFFVAAGKPALLEKERRQRLHESVRQLTREAKELGVSSAEVQRLLKVEYSDE